MEPQKWKQGYLEKLRTRDGECWFLRVREGKARKRYRIGLVSDYPSKASAQKAARHVRDAVNQPAVQAYRFGDVIARYLKEEIPQRYSTQRGYRRMIRLYIEPRWGATLLERVKAAEVRQWLMDFTLAPKTKAHMHGLMKSLFQYAMLWEWIPLAVNPMSLFFIPGGSKRIREPHILSPVQFEALFAEISNPMYRAMVITAMLTGVRCSELVGLKWEDVDFLETELRIHRGVVDGRIDRTKTPASRARIPMPDNLKSALSRYRAVTAYKEDGDWVFPAPMAEGKKPVLPDNVVQRVLVPAGQRAGIPFPIGWHVFRHTYKAWMDGLGADAAVKRDLMRHADIRTTENVYGGAQMEKMRELNSRVASLVRI